MPRFTTDENGRMVCISGYSRLMITLSLVGTAEAVLNQPGRPQKKLHIHEVGNSIVALDDEMQTVVNAQAMEIIDKAKS